MGGYLLNITLILQKAPGNVQRKIGAVQTALEQQQEFRNYLLDVVSHKHLVIIQLDLPLQGVKLMAQLREVYNPLHVEGIVHIDMDPEQRIVKISKYLMVEFLVFLIGTIPGVLKPQRTCVVDGLLFLLFVLFILLFGISFR